MHIKNWSFTQRPFVGKRHVDEYYILVNQVNGQRWVFNQSGGEIWDLLSYSTTLKHLVSTIATIHNCEISDVLEPVEEFLLILSQCQLIELLEDENPIKVNTLSEDMYPEYRSLYYQNQIIENILIETTYECNLRCRHCFIDKHQGSLSFETLSRIFTELRDMGTTDLTLSGGEIFLRNDVFDLFQLGFELGFTVSFITNGILLTEETVNKLKNMPFKNIKISLYSHIPEHHDQITQSSGSFQKTLEGIQRLISAGKVPIINAIIQSDNAQDIPHVKTLAESLGCQFECDYKIYPRHNGDQQPLQYYVSEDDLINLFDKSLVPPPVNYVCAAGNTRAKINPTGNVYICEFIYTPIGNIHTHSIKEIWNGGKRESLKNTLATYNPPECTECSMSDNCSRCPGLVWKDGQLQNCHHELMCFGARAYHKCQERVGNYVEEKS